MVDPKCRTRSSAPHPGLKRMKEGANFACSSAALLLQAASIRCHRHADRALHGCGSGAAGAPEAL